MTESATVLQRKNITTLYPDACLGLKVRFNMVYIELDKAFKEIRKPVSTTKQQPQQKLNKFERYLKSCNNDGHKMSESYYDSAKTQLMSRRVVDKNGLNDGPFVHYSEDGKSVTIGWYRKGKQHGKWLKKSENGVISEFGTIYNKKGEKISPDTSIYNGKLNKFWYDAKTDSMKSIMLDGKPTETYKQEMQSHIAKMQEDGKSGAVKVDEKLAELRAKIHPQTDNNKTLSSQPEHKTKIMYNALKLKDNHQQDK